MAPDSGERGLLPPEFEYRFRSAERRLASLERELQSLGGAEAAKGDIDDLRILMRELDKGMTEVIRSSRADTLKYVAFTVGPAMLAAAAIVVALLVGLPVTTRP